MSIPERFFYEKNDSIEGRKVHFETRQFMPGLPYKESEKIDNQMVFPFKMGIQGTIWIEQELDPKKALYCNKSKLDLGDSLRAQSIYVFCTKALPEIKITPTTATHKASVGNNKPSYAFARIEIPKRELAQRK